MKVLFLASHSKLAADSRIKVYQFLPLLERKGIKYKVVCFTPSFLYRLKLASEDNKKLSLVYYPISYIIKLLKIATAILLAPNFDIIFVQGPTIPFGLEKLLKLANKNIIFQFTDALFVNKNPGDGFIKRLKSKTLYNNWKGMAEVARCCLVENDYNKGAVIKFCPWVEKITGPIDADKYCPKEQKKSEDKFVIGWIGSPFTTKYLYDIKEAIKELSKKHNIIMRLIGAKKDFNIEGVDCEMKDWNFNTEIEWLSTFDVGVMPLTDDAWTKGKASYKLLQYMAMGIPAVISPVGLIGFDNKIVEDGVNGLLANTNKEWVEKISLLIEDKKLKEQIGNSARITIKEHYSLDKTSEKLLEIFGSILSKK